MYVFDSFMVNKFVDWAIILDKFIEYCFVFCIFCIGCFISYDIYEVFVVNFSSKVFFGEFFDNRYYFGIGFVICIC